MLGSDQSVLAGAVPHGTEMFNPSVIRPCSPPHICFYFQWISVRFRPTGEGQVCVVLYGSFGRADQSRTKWIHNGPVRLYPTNWQAEMAVVVLFLFLSRQFDPNSHLLKRVLVHLLKFALKIIIKQFGAN